MQRALRTIKILVAAAVIGLVPVGLTFWIFSASENYNYCASHNGQHPTGQYHTDNSPIIELPINRPTFGRLIVYCGGVWASDNGAGITAIGTLLLFFVTGILGWIAYRQYWTTRAQLRPYVLIDSCKISRDPGRVAPWAIHLVVKNFGATPALDMQIRTEKAINKRLPKDAILALSSNAVDTAKLTLAPDQHATVRLDFSELTGSGPDDWQLLRMAKNEAYLWGKITYRDVFRRPHWIIFQRAFHFGVVADFDTCESGNDSD